MSDLYAALLALTDRVERLVAEGGWAEASAAEVERRQLLERYVAQSADVASLRELLERNESMLEIAQAQRAALLVESGRLTERKRGLHAYAAHGAGRLVGDNRS